MVDAVAIGKLVFGKIIGKCFSVTAEKWFTPNLQAKLITATGSWAAALPAECECEALAASPVTTVADQPDAPGPATSHVKQILDRRDIPSVGEFEAAILENRIAVARQFPPGDCQGFFAATEDAVRPHIRRLAEALRSICTEDDQQFRANTTNKLDSIIDRIDAVATSTTGVLGAEIDIAAGYLKESRPSATIAKLEEIQRRHWGGLDANGRFRVLAILGHSHGNIGEVRKAANFYLQAKALLPDDVRSAALEAVAYSYLGDQAKARALAAAALQRDPTSSLAVSILVQTAPDDMPLAEVKGLVPEHLAKEAGILHRLGWRALNQGDDAAAESIAREALRAEPQSAYMKELLGIAIVRVAGSCAGDGRAADPVRLSEAKDLLTDALKTLTAPDDVARLRSARAVANELLCLPSEADADHHAAIDAQPSHPGYFDCFVNSLIRRNRPDAAIELLEKAIVTCPNIPFEVLLANLLAERNGARDRARAVEILTSCLPRAAGADSDTRWAIIAALVQLYCLAHQPERAEQLLSDLAPDYLPAAARHAIQSEIYGRTRRAVEAAKSALAARDALSADANINARLRVGEALAKADEHRAALDLFKPHVRPGRVTELTRKVLFSAYYADDAEYLLSYCAQLRSNGVGDPFCLRLEVGTCIRYRAFPKAIEIIQSYLNRPGDDEVAKEFRAELSVLGYRLNRPELIEADPAKLPSVQTAPIEVACKVAMILKNSAVPANGVRYAYELLRKHFSDMEAHITFMAAFGPGDKIASEFPAPSAVETGVAVCYEANDTHEKKWVIIEDLPNPNVVINEHAPDSPLGMALMGKKPGEPFVLRDDYFQPVTGTVQAIVNKYEYRRQSVPREGEKLFGPAFPTKTYTFPERPDGSLDFSVLFRSLDVREAEADLFHAQYRQHPLSVSSFATVARTGILDSLQHLAAQRDLPIRCCLGNPSEWDAAETVLREGAPLVVDPTAIATLYFADHIASAIRMPTRLLVCEGTLEEYRDRIREHSSPPSGFLGKHRGRYFSINQEQIDSATELRKTVTFLQRVTERFQVVSGENLAKIEPAARQELTDLFGPETAEAVAHAAVSGAALWTDDLGVATVASSLLGVRSVWTQRIFHHFLTTGLIDEKDLVDLTIHLVKWNYQFSRFDRSVFDEAGRRSHWDPASEPFASVIRYFSLRETTYEGLLPLAAFAVQSVYRHAQLAHQQEACVSALLRSILNRPDGRCFIGDLIGHAQEIFGINVVAEASFKRHARRLLTGLVE